MSEPILEINDLHVRFRMDFGEVQAVRGVSFSINQGEIYGMVGESGCGKSVIASSILRMVPPPGEITAGSIVFEGEEIIGLSDKKMRTIRGKRISMIFQDPTTSLNPVFTVGKQIIKVIHQHTDLNRDETSRRALQLLKDVDLPDPKRIINTYPHQLSGGMQQRVMIAIALAANPQLLIADEPTTALDVTIQAQILELLTHIRKDRGIAILLITHNLGVVAENCDRVGVLYAGKLVEEGTVKEFFDQSLHPYSHGLLAALPRLTDQVLSLQAIPGNVPSGLERKVGCSFAPRCPYVMDRCQQEDPQVKTITPGHRVACFYVEVE